MLQNINFNITCLPKPYQKNFTFYWSEIDSVVSNFLCQNVQTTVGGGVRAKSERPHFFWLLPLAILTLFLMVIIFILQSVWNWTCWVNSSKQYQSICFFQNWNCFTLVKNEEIKTDKNYTVSDRKYFVFQYFDDHKKREQSGKEK